MKKEEIYTKIKNDLLTLSSRFLPFSTTNFGKKVLSSLSVAKIYFFKYKEDILKISLPLFVILWGLYSCSGINKNVDLDVENIFRISDDIRSFYSDKADYWGLSTDFVTDNKIIENKFIRNKKIVIGANKELFVGRGSNAEKIMPGTKVFDVVLKKLNKKQCVSFLEATISPSNQVKLLSISVENTDKTKVFEWGNDKINLPITKGIGEEFCTDSNTIIWTIK